MDFKKDLSNLFTVYIFSFLAIPFSYFVRLIYSRVLTVEQFGLFYAFASVNSFLLMFIALGIPSALKFYIPKYLKEENYSKVKSLFLKFLLRKLGLIFIISIPIIIFCKSIALFYFKSVDYYWVVILIIPFLLCITFASFLTHFARGVNNPKIYSSFNPFRLIISFLFSLLLFLGLCVKNVVFFAISLELLTYGLTIIYAIIIFRKYHHIFKAPYASFPDSEKEVKGYGHYTFFNSALGILMTQIDTVMITVMLGLKSVALYQVALPIANLLHFLMNPLRDWVFPTFCKFYHDNNIEAIKSFLAHIYQLSIIIFLPINIVFFVFSKYILQVLFGTNFVEGYIVLMILSIGMFLMSFSTFNFSVLDATGLIKVKSKIMVVGAFLNVSLNIILMLLLGVSGVALATCLVYFVMVFWSLDVIRRDYPFKIRMFWRTLFFNGLLFSGLMLCKYYFVQNIFHVIMVVVCSAIVYSALIFLSKTVDLKTVKLLISGLKK